jgi:hypothetical protein
VEALTLVAELGSVDYLAVDDASSAVAAAELVAMTLGVVDRVKINSALSELWSEGPEHDQDEPDPEWLAALEDLETRLSA